MQREAKKYLFDMRRAAGLVAEFTAGLSFEVVFVSTRGGSRTLWRINIDGSNPAKLGAWAIAFRPVVSFDGQWVYYSNSQRQNFRIPVAGGTPEPLLAELTAGGRQLPPGFHEPIPSPDGRALAGHHAEPFALSSDQKHVAFVRGQTTSDVVLVQQRAAQ